MPRKRKRPQVVKIARALFRDPAGALAWTTLACVLWSVLCVTYGLGGILAFPVALEWSTWSVPLALLLFGLWWRCQPPPRALQFGGIALFPWLAFLGVSWLFLSPASWQGALEFVMWAQALALMFIVIHITRERPLLYGFVIGLGVLAFAVGMVALYQYFFRPGWLPLGRVQVPQFLDRASWPFGVPNSLAGLMLLILPITLSVAAMNRYAGPLRAGSGMLSLVMLLAITLSVSRGAYVALLLVLLACPVLLFERPRHRYRAWGYGFLSLLLLGAFFYATNRGLGDRIAQAFRDGGEPTRPIMWETAWNMFMDNPVVGQGASSYAVQWELFRPPEGYMTPLYAHSDYLQVLGEYGVLGFLLLFAPIAWILFMGWRQWLGLPFQRISGEASFRALHHNIHAMTDDARKQHIRRKRRGRFDSPAPAGKVLLAGMVLGLCAFMIHMALEFHLHLASLVFILCILLALMARLGGAPRFMSSSRAGAVAVMLGCWMAAVGIFVISMPAVLAQVYYLEGRELRGNVAVDTKRPLPEALRDLTLAELDMELATNLVPEHADAWAEWGRVRMEVGVLLPGEARTQGESAEPLIRKATTLQPENWMYWRDLGRAMAMQRAPVADVEAAYRKATELAPFTPVSWYFLGEYLSRVPGRHDDAASAIGRALELYPDYTPAQDVKRSLLLRRQ